MIEKREYRDAPPEVRHNISRLIVAIKNAYPECVGVQITVEGFNQNPPSLDLKLKMTKK